LAEQIEVINDCLIANRGVLVMKPFAPVGEVIPSPLHLEASTPFSAV